VRKGCGPLLVVGRDPAIAAALAHVLENEGHRVVTVNSGQEALGMAKRLRPGVVVVDLGSHEREAELIRALRRGAMDPEPAVVVATDGLEMDGDRITRLPRPFAPDQLVDAVTALCGG